MDNTIRVANTSLPISLAGRANTKIPIEKTQLLPSDSIEISRSVPKEKAAAPSYVKVTVLPHDPCVAKPETINFEKDNIGSSLSSPKIKAIDSSNPVAIADLEGNYLFELGTPQFDQATSYATAFKTTEMWEDYKETPVKWAFGNRPLGVNAHKKEGMNAYYSRNEASANFYYFKSPVLSKTVQTSQSPDIVSHEIGHGVLDSIKPGYLGWDTETMSVHEAFADSSAMLFALKNDTNVKQILDENGGDFKKESALSRLAEEFGKALKLGDNDPSNDNRIYLRSALNNFKYVDPSTLPERTNEDNLANECHSFSRVLTGAVYDIISDIFSANVASGMSKEEALKSAGDAVGKLWIRSAQDAPANMCKFKDIASGMLKADGVLNGGKNAELLKNIFVERNIMTPKDLSAMEIHTQSLPDVQLKSDRALSPEGAQSIIEKYGHQLGVPDGIVFTMGKETKNMYGGKSVNLETKSELQLDGPHFGKHSGSFVDVKGGLKLDFDKNGKLVDYHYDAINDSKKADTLAGVADAIKNNLVAEESSIEAEESSKFLAQVVTSDDGRKKLERLPIIIM